MHFVALICIFVFVSAVTPNTEMLQKNNKIQLKKFFLNAHHPQAQGVKQHVFTYMYVNANYSNGWTINHCSWFKNI